MAQFDFNNQIKDMQMERRQNDFVQKLIQFIMKKDDHSSPLILHH